MSRTLLAFLSLLTVAASPPLRDVIDGRVDLSAAERFAAVWTRTGGKPTAADLEAGYLKDGGRPIAIFTPGRITSADHLARAVAANPALYRDAVERCLPWARQQDGQYRAVNLALRGLLPDRAPPAVAIVVGADNSGGTAGQGMQVLGLEVLCRLAPDRAAFDALLRRFFAHESVHALQSVGGPKANADWLLTQVIVEGTADYVAWLTTGQMPDPDRARWAEGRGAALWSDFQKDRATVAAALGSNGRIEGAGEQAAKRWVMNAGSAPEGWPGEAGYWVGMQIARAYVEASPDPRQALETLLAFDDPAPILARAATRLPVARPLLAPVKPPTAS